ncbi:MAG: ATP-dependent helicase [Candidatus Heimdallarchaeota archaeon]|nr:ATP-dependent helicase [Candidatus Heimdallarchaeota archaeon]
MEIIHSHWNQQHLEIWAENSNFKKNRQANNNKHFENECSAIHPFIIPSIQLEEIITSNFHFDLAKIKGQLTGSINLLLPSFDNKPLPSFENNRFIFSQNKITFQEWMIKTVSLEAYTAFDFLLSLPDDSPDSIIFSSSLKFWKLVAEFILSLIIRKSFIPGINVCSKNSNTTTFVGSWKAIISTKEDKKRLEFLVNSIPPYCQAIIQEKETTVKGLIISFIDTCIDAFLKKKLGLFLPPLQNGADFQEYEPITRAWMESLFDQNNHNLIAPTKKYAIFAGMVNAWLQKICPKEEEKHFQTCFRLQSPEPSEDLNCWKISFHLEAANDETIMIPAKEIWQSRLGIIRVLEDNYENPQERLMKDLGKASLIYPKLDNCLENSFPTSLILNTKQAIVFLKKYAQKLEQADFKVLLPSWWQKPSSKLGVHVILSEKEQDNANQSRGLFTLHSLIDFEWQIVVGDQSLSLEDFENWAKLRVPFIRIGGQWVRIDLDEIDTTIAFIEEKFGTLSFGEALQYQLTHSNKSDLGIPSITIEGKGSVKSHLKKLTQKSKITPILTPKQFNGMLRPYQKNGLSWLVYLQQIGFGACLADDMGLGKTIQIIAFLLYLQEIDSSTNDYPSVIICPTSILGNWSKEFEQFAPSLKVIIHHGSRRFSGKEFLEKVKEYDVVITTYNLVHRDFDDFSAVTWQNIILDEAQNIKNPHAKQTRSIKKLHGIFRVALTGTPIENSLSELWSIMDFLNPRYLGPLKQFNSHFTDPIESHHNEQKMDQLSQIIQPFILRRIKTDPKIIKDLPEKMEMKIYCSLTEEQALLYEAVVQNLFTQLQNIEGIQRKGLILSSITKLKQICNHPAQFTGQNKHSLSGRSNKFSRLSEMLEEVLANDEKALIFTQYAELGTMLKDYLENIFERDVLYLYGGTSQKKREQLIQRFQQEDHPAPSIFILSLKAGGVGLNLTAANHVFHVDRWWNPAVETQATDRAYRIGQNKAVFVYKFICPGTLEERIDQLIEKKKNLAQNLLTTGEAWLTELSTEQLREVLILKSMV